MKWNEYTWYSKWASLLFFIIILPIFTFYIGTQYELTKLSLENQSEQITVVQNITNTYTNEKYGFEFKYSPELTYTEELLNGKDFVIHFSTGKPGYTLTVTASPIDDFILASGQEPAYYEKNTNELVTYDSVDKKKVVLREKPSISQNGWDGFYVFSNLVIPNTKTGYTISIDESMTPEKVKFQDNSLVIDSFKLI